jgi:hypothetical protein
VSRFKLSDWLGGQVYDANGDFPAHMDHEQIELIVPELGNVWFPAEFLTEVPPPAPPEPPHGTVLRKNRPFASVWECINEPEQHNGDHHWFTVGGRQHPQGWSGYTWEEVWTHIYRGYTVLVPDPAADAVLPFALGSCQRSAKVYVLDGGRVSLAIENEWYTPEEAERIAAAILRAAREAKGGQS